MQDVLYTANMCCFYWLMNKATLTYGRAEYSQVGNQSRDTGEEGQGQERDASKPPEQQDAREQVTPHGATQILRNGFICM